MALNRAFEKVAEAATKRLAGDVKKIGKQQGREIERTGQRVGKRITNEASEALQAALKKALREVESAASALGLDADEARELRRGLETVNGLIAGAKRGAQLGAILGPQGSAAGGV